MGNSLPIKFTNPKESRFYRELKEGLNGFSNDELLQIFIQTAREAGVATWKSKVTAVKNIGGFAKKTFDRYKRDGVKESLQSDMKSAGDFVSSLPEKTRAVYNHFLSLSREEKIEAAAKH